VECTYRMESVFLVVVTPRVRTVTFVLLTALASVLTLYCPPLGASVTSARLTTTLEGLVASLVGVTVLELQTAAWAVTLIQASAHVWRSVPCSSLTQGGVSLAALTSGTSTLSAVIVDVTRMAQAVYNVTSTLDSVLVSRELTVSHVILVRMVTLIWSRDVCPVTVTNLTLSTETLLVTCLDSVDVRQAWCTQTL